MPNCFTLTRKSNPEAGPVGLTQIDEELCEALSEQPDPVRYYREWFNLQGFSLAMGRSWSEIKTLFPDPEDLAVTEWLEANFIADAWCER